MAAAAAASGAVESIVVVHNVAKRHNVGTLARSATAFGVAEVVVVGRRDVSAFGSHGSTSHLRFRHFTTLATACAYLKVISALAQQIPESARPILKP
jgi:tRNA G18 (ribose-2'-O)-methylase SpoU